MLPVKLPEIKKFNTNGNPLTEISEWKNINIDGKAYTRETDTLDTFVDSSWYFLRFCSPEIEDYAFKNEDVNYWMPVDQYIGGVECYFAYFIQDFMHAISFKNKNFNIKEPFKGLFTQGMVCHETYKDQNNNWVSPDDIITIKGKKFLKMIIAKKLLLAPQSRCSKSKTLLILRK